MPQQPSFTQPIRTDLAVRELAARYSRQFLALRIRRQRIDAQWLGRTLAAVQPRDGQRTRWEDAELRETLKTLPLPHSVAEFKNHPL